MKLAQNAKDRGDFAKAQDLLSQVLAQNSEPHLVKCMVLQADLSWDSGNRPAAFQTLEDLQKLRPGNVWPLYHLAERHARTDDFKAALQHLDRLDALPSKGDFLWGDLLRVDVLTRTGQQTDAAALLDRLAGAHPDNPTIPLRQAQLARLMGDQDALLRALDATLANTPENSAPVLQIAQILATEGLHEQAIARLETFHKAQGGDAQLLLKLAELCRQRGRDEDEHTYLLQACQTAPTAPSVLQHMFTHKSDHLDAQTAEQLFTHLQARQNPQVIEDLKIKHAFQSNDFQTAFDLLTQTPVKRRSPQQAHLLAQCLFGTHRYRLGQRYLRLCLRRWPNNASLWQMLMHRAIKQCFSDQAMTNLETARADLPPHVYWSARLYAHAFRNDLEGAILCYWKLRDIKHLAQHHRNIMARLIYTRQDLRDLDVLFERIGNPGAESARLLHRGGLIGQMTLELNLESRALSHSPPYANFSDWLRARPQSTIAAIRVVDEWREKQGQSRQTGADIPHRIFQYWDASTPPEALHDIKQTWQSVPGFDYRFMNRRDALSYISQHFDRSWIRAFTMAQNACEESDLLRLCLLAREGGIWADTDDFLYGDLQAILGDGKGLILFREPMGGAIGNNFIAAPPKHPVILRAAKMTQAALLRRDNENAWNKTGPGLLTRALAHTLLRDTSSDSIETTVLDWQIIGRQIVTNIPLSYKKTAAHWQSTDRRSMNTRAIWQSLLNGLETA